MAQHLKREIEKIKHKILGLGALVEESVYRATKALAERNPAMAREVLQGDEAIDSVEVDVEEECLKILALHQPVAIDLRFIVAVLKINNDLERIGDLANNVAFRAESLTKLPQIVSPFDFPHMASLVRSMLSDSLGALVGLDTALARKVCAADDAVDAINREVYQKIAGHIRAQPDHTEALIHYFSASRNLERIGDHATNIAEDVIYMVEGEIVRHGLAKGESPREA